MGWAEEGWPAVLDRWERASTAAGEAEAPARRPPATEGQLSELEARIGNRLPPSYRAFLLTTNGLSTSALGPSEEPLDSLLPAERIQTPGGNHGMGWVWLSAQEGLAWLFDVDGNVAAQLLDPEEYSCPGHMLYAIKIDGWPPEFYTLLDPLDVDADGEWRAWEGYKESCTKRRSFGDVIEAAIARLEQPKEPEFYRHVADQSPGGQEVLTLEAQLEVGGAVAERAVERLVQIVTTPTRAYSPERLQAVWALLRSNAPVAQEAILREIENHPEDGIVIWNALQSGIARQRTDRLKTALMRVLLAPEGHRYASSLRQWPELVEEAWLTTRNPVWLPHLQGRPGMLQAAIEALAQPELSFEVRSDLCYQLGYSAGSLPSDREHAEAMRRVAHLHGNNQLDLARALLGMGETDKAMSLLDESLEQPNPHTAYLFMKLMEQVPAQAAVPVLVASLRRQPTAYVVHALACYDHPDSVPELAHQLDGALRVDALIALEKLGTGAARDVVAKRAASGDLEAARALARRRDERALEPLLRQTHGPNQRSAVTGLRDLRHPTSHQILTRIAAEDPDDNVAVIAAHGLVMAWPEGARAAVATLLRRDNPDVRKLAEHWLEFLPD